MSNQNEYPASNSHEATPEQLLDALTASEERLARLQTELDTIREERRQIAEQRTAHSLKGWLSDAIISGLSSEPEAGTTSTSLIREFVTDDGNELTVMADCPSDSERTYWTIALTRSQPGKTTSSIYGFHLSESETTGEIRVLPSGSEIPLSPDATESLLNTVRHSTPTGPTECE